MINLLSPNRDDLLKKWAHVIEATKHIGTWTNESELSWLAEYATRITRCLEVGSYNGRSAKVMLLANPTLELVSLDTWDDGNFPQYEHNLGPEIGAKRVTYFQGESQTTIKQVKGLFDGCFIDGGHLEHLVISDIKGVLPRMKPGSLMAGHDFRSEGDGLNDVGRGVKTALPDAGAVCDSIWAYQL